VSKQNREKAEERTRLLMTRGNLRPCGDNDLFFPKALTYEQFTGSYVLLTLRFKTKARNGAFREDSPKLFFKIRKTDFDIYSYLLI